MQTGHQGGFTLIELLVVVLIITILGAVVGVNLADKPHQARHAAVVAQLQNFRQALKFYQMDNGAYPTQRQGLQALVAPSPLEPQPGRFPANGYLERRDVPLDPWHNPYVYLIPGSGGEPYEVLSYGADGQPGGTDKAADISTSTL